MSYETKVERAISDFWKARSAQHKRQGSKSGKKDAGNRSAVTGGKHLDSFINLLIEEMESAGLPSAQVFKGATTIPGFFRPAKNWDLLAVSDGALVAAIELKAHIGPSFGNNFNNRVEEALGNSVDVLKAHREGAFSNPRKPWLGWLMLLEDCEKTTKAVKISEPHFPAFPEFSGASYAQRYEIFCDRLMREGLYDSTCLLMSDREHGPKGRYWEPNQQFGFATFTKSLRAHCMNY